MPIKEIKLKDFPFKSVHMDFLGVCSPGIYRSLAGKYVYGIRILDSETRSRTGGSSIRYGYFELDETGLITKAPRDLQKQYAKKVRITDIAKHAI